MPPRVAYFPDSFHEVNGVAHTSRNFVAYAKRHCLPFLCVCADEVGNIVNDRVSRRGDVQMLQLKRSRLAVRLEHDLYFDPFFFRHNTVIEETLRKFKPDIIHVTGPSELGLAGAYFAWKLKIPLVASWHTNIHEYASRRIERFTRWLGDSAGTIGRGVEANTLNVTTLFYKQARVLYAPNPKLCVLLEQKTGRPCHLMKRGVDTNMFTPARYARPRNDGRIVLGFVGRLSVEKNIALLPKINKELRARQVSVEWLIVGQGSEEEMLQRQLSATAHFTGVLHGDALADAYANMDLLVFPSHTDTFGNVVLEALASGVPAIVTPDNGPATIVRDGYTGRVVEDAGFSSAIIEVLENDKQHLSMREAARVYALSCSWDGVFDCAYVGYSVCNGYPLPRRHLTFGLFSVSLKWGA
jgi:phosphatidylinositol alpha 1,6-mannosyltransferase